MDGNEVDEMTAALKQAKRLLKEKSVLLHIVTKKGKGYGFCEEHPGETHGVPPVGAKKEREYSEILGENLTPADIRKMTNDELNVLCDELRSFIYEKVSECGGHLASNLGAIEATVALCNVFDFTKDKIVFDVGHQCYAYKALTGRADQFDSLRKELSLIHI